MHRLAEALAGNKPLNGVTPHNAITEAIAGPFIGLAHPAASLAASQLPSIMGHFGLDCTFDRLRLYHKPLHYHVAIGQRKPSSKEQKVMQCILVYIQAILKIGSFLKANEFDENVGTRCWGRRKPASTPQRLSFFPRHSGNCLLSSLWDNERHTV
jgi:hypothetical protein